MLNIPTIDSDLVKAIPWTGDSAQYDLDLFALGQGLDKFFIVNSGTIPNVYEMISEVPDVAKCVVWKNNGEWVVKCFRKDWTPDLGYTEINFVPKLLWRKNPDLDQTMTFEDNPFAVYKPDLWDSRYELVWYMDPRFNPGPEKVWVMSCRTIGFGIEGTKDMGYVTPKVKVEFNEDLPKLDIDLDQCYPPYWDLVNECVWELDPVHIPDKKTWLFKISPSYRKPKAWVWYGIITPEFVVEYNPDLPKINYTGNYVVPWHDLAYEHVWYLKENKEKIWAIKARAVENVVGVKDMGNLLLDIAQLDVVFISYDEPNAEENWQRVLEKAPHAKRVSGVTGIFEAHKAAAKLAKTDMFYVVDGDAWLVDEWQFDYQPEIFDRDCSYVWHSKNPINDLEYGYGGVKLFPRRAFSKIKVWKTLDLLTTIVPKLKVIDEVSNITAFNTDEFATWRSAFRETIKLCRTIAQDPNNTEAIDRLSAWETLGADRPFGNYARSAVHHAREFFEENNNVPTLQQINNRSWLHTMFKSKKLTAFDYKPIKIVKKEETVAVDPGAYIRLEHSNLDHKDWFVVNWCLGNTCNFSCSYCPDDLHDHSIPWPEFDVIKQFISNVKETHRDKKIYFEFTGGEVTLYKHFIELCQFCTELDIKVGLISNGSRTLRYWEENKQYFDHVCLSFHPEEAEEDHFINVVKILNNDVRTHVNIMMSPERFDFCYAVANKVKNLGNISMALQPLIHDFGDTLYDYDQFQKKVFEKQHELIVKHIKYTKTFDYYRGAMAKVNVDGHRQVSSAHRFISEKTNDWSGWKCFAGVEQLIVDKDGSIHRGWCKEGGAIGHITDPNLNLLVDPVVCGNNMCHCNFDIMCTKEK